MTHWAEKLQEAACERGRSIEARKLQDHARLCILAEKAFRKRVQSIDPDAKPDIEHDIRDAIISVKMPEGEIRLGFHLYGECKGLFMHGECPRCGEPAESKNISYWYELAKLIENFEPSFAHICNDTGDLTP